MKKGGREEEAYFSKAIRWNGDIPESAHVMVDHSFSFTPHWEVVSRHWSPTFAKLMAERKSRRRTADPIRPTSTTPTKSNISGETSNISDRVEVPPETSVDEMKVSDPEFDDSNPNPPSVREHVSIDEHLR